ncbi:MAG TPA: TfoX/Sxy family protein [Bryobacteraceae bacterium]|nr:TfoX/Sxy family protein [Bryobacteraceae bacterium]
MPPPRDPFVDFLLEQFAPLGQMHARAMFGGYCLYCDAVVFALVADSALFLKADDLNRGAFEERRLKPFKPFPDRDDVMSYYEAPPEIFEDPDQMRQWCGGAIEAGRRAQAKKGTRTKRAKR